MLGIKDADSAENNPHSKNIVISPVSCAIPNRNENSPKLSGNIPEIRIRPGSYLEGFYKKEIVTEEFFCNYEVNPDFEGAIIEAGFAIAARGENGETFFRQRIANQLDQIRLVVDQQGGSLAHGPSPPHQHISRPY